MGADALGNRSGRSSSAVACALGMIAAHRGEFVAAAESIREARTMPREHGERLAEFYAVEHWAMVEIDRGRFEACTELPEQTADLGGKVRPGAEAAAGRALLAFARCQSGDATTHEVEEALEAVRTADANHERAAGRRDPARRLAEDALSVSRAIGRPSETALCHAVLAACTEGERRGRDRGIGASRSVSQDPRSRS